MSFKIRCPRCDTLFEFTTAEEYNTTADEPPSVFVHEDSVIVACPSSSCHYQEEHSLVEDEEG